PHWQTFLQWLDNNTDVATRLIAQVVAGRDRWPARVLAGEPVALRADVERALAHEARETLRIVRDRIPAALAAALSAFARQATEYFATSGSEPTFATALQTLAQDRALPDTDARDAWCALADWL